MKAKAKMKMKQLSLKKTFFDAFLLREWSLVTAAARCLHLAGTSAVADRRIFLI